MKFKAATLLALGGLALGFVTGRATVPQPASMADADAATPVALRKEHPRVGERSLGDAVASTLRVMPSAGGATRAMTGNRATELDARLNIVDQADELRRQRRFEEAIVLYRRAVADGRMTADSWADYADALASVASSLQGEPEKALAQALALEPRHAKALWLKASLQHEQRRYQDAVRTWRSLLAVVPQDSSDARIIQANIDEASRLATGA